MSDRAAHPGADGWGPDVDYRLERKTPGSSEVVEIAPPACPSCGASWSPRGAVQVGHGGRRTYRCGACTVTHYGRLKISDPWIQEQLQTNRRYRTPGDDQ